MAADRFWTQQEQFLGQVVHRPFFARKRAQWESRGHRYLSAYGGMRKDALIQTDPQLHRTLLDLMGRAAPLLARAFEKHLGDLAEQAFEKWPVWSGLSKSLLALEFEVVGVDGSRFVGTVRNRAPYAVFIGYDKYSRGAIARDLLWDPGEEAATKIAQDAARELGR